MKAFDRRRSIPALLANSIRRFGAAGAAHNITDEVVHRNLQEEAIGRRIEGIAKRNPSVTPAAPPTTHKAS